MKIPDPGDFGRRSRSSIVILQSCQNFVLETVFSRGMVIVDSSPTYRKTGAISIGPVNRPSYLLRVGNVHEAYLPVAIVQNSEIGGCVLNHSVSVNQLP